MQASLFHFVSWDKIQEALSPLNEINSWPTRDIEINLNNQQFA